MSSNLKGHFYSHKLKVSEQLRIVITLGKQTYVSPASQASQTSKSQGRIPQTLNKAGDAFGIGGVSNSFNSPRTNTNQS